MRALYAVLLAAAAAFQPSSADPVFTPDTVVRIDASAVDARGRFVDTLALRDFDLREDGVAQKIETVRLVRAGSAPEPAAAPAAINSDADEQAEAQRPGARLFAIYLDEYQVAPGDAAGRIRDALTQFVDRDLGPRDLILVMKPLDSVLTIRLSHDRDAARAAIAAFTGRKGDYEPRNAYEKNFMATDVAAVDQTRTQVTLSALNALAVHLGWVSADARKTLIVVSEGVAHGMRRRGLTLPTLDAVVRSANRYNVAVYPIDPTGENAGEQAAEDALRTLASETDGQAVLTSGDLSPAFVRISADASAYYLLTYHSPKKVDGHFHEIELRVKRPGVKVRTRQGYWATSVDDLLRAEWLARDALPKKPVVLEPPRHVSAMIRPWFGVAQGDGGKTRVTFVWEPVRTLGDRFRRVPARIELTALGSDDAPVFQGPVLPTGAGASDGAEAEPLRAVFDVPPGSLRLRMSIEDTGLQVIDSDVRQIAIRDLSKGVELGTPEVLRARNARDFREMSGDPKAAPVAAREFSRTERLLIRVPAYSPDGTRPSVSARLLSRGGQAMRALTVQPPTAPDGLYRIDLSLAGLAAGDYLIELAATSAAGEAKDLMTFRVTS
jgi:VWFA-related protein